MAHKHMQNNIDVKALLLMAIPIFECFCFQYPTCFYNKLVTQ